MKYANLLVIVFLAGCVPQQRFRYVYPQPGCFDNRTDPISGGQPRPYPSLDCRNGYFKTAFIEFDEDGHPIDPEQERKALALIDFEKRRAPGGKIITLVYAHGWKNNARPANMGRGPQDVERFESALSQLAYMGRVDATERANNKAREVAKATGTQPRLVTVANNPDVPIVGVYIGWRGKSLMGPGWYTWTSYWFRRNTANRVGSAELAGTLNRVIDRTNEGASSSRVLLLGHSFGARVLEHAIETQQVKLYDSVRGQESVAPRVDLVLYVNSANDARLSIARMMALKSDHITVRHPDYNQAACAGGKVDRICREYPLMVAITSRGDQATKFLLPVANSLYPDRRSAPTPPAPTGTFLDNVPPAAVYKRAAAGHLRFLHSHDVLDTPCPRRTPPACDKPECVFAFQTTGDSKVCYAVSARQKQGSKNVLNDTAFWIMAVDKPVIPDHGGIWTLTFMNMLAELMKPRDFFEPASKRVQLRLK